MEDWDDVPWEAEGGDEGKPFSRGKPLGRLDKQVEATLACARALRAVGLSLDEGPLRTACLEEAAKALSWAKDARFDATLARARGRRADRDDLRAVAISARKRPEDGE